MEIKEQREVKNLSKEDRSKKEGQFSESQKGSFLKDSNPSKIFLKKNVEKVKEINFLIDIIRANAPISMWELSKKTNISNSKLYYLIRDLEFSGVIHSKIRLNENNRSERVIFSDKPEVENDQK